MVLIPASSLQLIWTSCRWGYIIIWSPPTSCERHNSHSIRPVDSQGCPLISSTGCTCYLHRCISSFDSLAWVNMLQYVTNGWSLATVSAWKNSVNAAVGGVGLLIGPRALKTLNSVEKIQPRMMAATFNGNPRATIISCYSPTNVSEENELVTFYDELSSLVRSIPKHNMLVIGGDMNAQIGKNGNNKYSLHNTSNRNGQHLTDFMIENRLSCLNTNYQKREGKLWTYTYANNTKAQIDYVLMNKKWKNSALNCEAYFSFEGVSTDHRIVTAKIRLSLRKNAKRTATTKHYDWALLNNKDVRDKYVLELRNRFETLQ